jgi:hypothetical protein
MMSRLLAFSLLRSLALAKLNDANQYKGELALEQERAKQGALQERLDQTLKAIYMSEGELMLIREAAVAHPPDPGRSAMIHPLGQDAGIPRGASHGHDQHDEMTRLELKAQATVGSDAISMGELMHEASDAPSLPRRSWIVGISSLCFVLLQSVCTAFMAISGLRLVIGIGSLAAATSAAKQLDSIHGTAIRIPMMVLALFGSIVNLIAIWRVRRLRARPSSQWRILPISREKKRAETIQIVLACLTILLIYVEGARHVSTFGSLFR